MKSLENTLEIYKLRAQDAAMTPQQRADTYRPVEQMAIMAFDTIAGSVADDIFQIERRGRRHWFPPIIVEELDVVGSSVLLVAELGRKFGEPSQRRIDMQILPAGDKERRTSTGVRTVDRLKTGTLGDSIADLTLETNEAKSNPADYTVDRVENIRKFYVVAQDIGQLVLPDTTEFLP